MSENAVNTGQQEDPRAALWPNYSPPDGLIFTHGKGSELFTESGDSYLDCLSGIAVTSFGHSHPHLVNALTEQASKLWHLSNVFRIPAAEQLARRLVANSFADSVFFANSGTEAIEAGLKAMRGFHAAQGNEERFRIIGFTESFHGRTIAALAAAGNNSHMQNFVPTDYGFDQVEWENLDALKSTIGSNTAGIVLETIQGEGGIRPVSKSFLQAVRNLCDEHGLLLMVDEVQCGVGRSGNLFAYESYGIRPDVMALAKGLGGGFPIGVCLSTQEVGQTMVVGTHGSTFGGNPLAAVVGNAVLDLMLEDGLLDSVKSKGQFFGEKIEQLIAKYPDAIESVHGQGLMLGIKCKVPNTDVLVKLRDNKLLVGKSGSNMIRLLPPLNISQEHIEKAISILDVTLAEFKE
ncbi:MAG: aspartate aminotransferase family protein [Gammaproteobacteria bacterium]|nr:aspartate aminotransferase family protein [Gammaproteobacteria bacterium]